MERAFTHFVSLACLDELNHFGISQTCEPHPSLTHWASKERESKENKKKKKKVVIMGSFLSSKQ